MAFIDHRILIPAPQSVVWDYIGKLVNCTKWQVDCSKIAFLTTRQEGVGTRYRLTTPQGREYVAEIRAWYEGLGYEYSYVERPPFKSALGRVRLQEIPEGTVVQWTLEYEIGGVLGGVRGALGVARQLDNDIAQSLKKLYLQIKTDRARIIEPIGAPKALMRDAPDAEARAVYRPRHPSAVPQDEESSADALPPVRHAPALEEPPAAHDDTRPNRPVEGEQAAVPAPVLPEPSFLAEVPEPEPASQEDTLLGDPLSHAQQIDISAISRELTDQTVDAEPAEAASEAQLTEQLTSTAEPVETDDKRSTRETASVKPEPEPTTPALSPVIEEPPLGSDSERLLDTSKVSIWEVFGLPRPSDSEELKAVTVSPAEPDVPALPPTVLPAMLPSEADDEVETSVAPGDSIPAERWQRPRIGLRLKLRRKHLRLRRFF